MLATEEIIDALVRAEPGLRKYLWLQAKVRAVDVTGDDEFQRKFNGFYRVRKALPWRRDFYALMEYAKSNEMSFEDALYVLNDFTGTIDASFVSKLVATLDPTKPVIDKFVLGHFGLSIPPYTSRNRLQGCCEVYQSLCERYEQLLCTEFASGVRELFRIAYPWANVTPLKMIDLVLWQTRGDTDNAFDPAADAIESPQDPFAE